MSCCNPPSHCPTGVVLQDIVEQARRRYYDHGTITDFNSAAEALAHHLGVDRASILLHSNHPSNPAWRPVRSLRRIP